MKIHFFSDAHADINRISDPAYILKTDEHADLYIDAGDTGGLQATRSFYNHSFWNDKQAIFVGGNHLCYGVEKPLPQVEDELSEEFHLRNNVSFLQNSEKRFGNIIVLGTTLWTDFNLFGTPEYSMKSCNENMNDFDSVKYTEDSFLTPKITVSLHNMAKKYIHNRLIKNPKCKFIIVTHHTPSLRSAAPQYKNSSITPGFCNDMEDFIEKHNNILLWIHGHVHNTVYYNIGDVPVVCNPFGYRLYQESTGYVTDAILDV